MKIPHALALRTMLAATVLLVAASGHAQPLSTGRMAVLRFDKRLKGRDADQVDTVYFEDEVRRIARELLPRVDLTTRQNMLALAESNHEDLSRCDESQCVEVGRVLGADTVVFGYVTKVGSTFVLALSLHETRGVGKLLRNGHADGTSVDELVQKTDATVRDLLQPLMADRVHEPLAQGREDRQDPVLVREPPLGPRATTFMPEPKNPTISVPAQVTERAPLPRCTTSRPTWPLWVGGIGLATWAGAGAGTLVVHSQLQGLPAGSPSVGSKMVTGTALLVVANVGAIAAVVGGVKWLFFSGPSTPRSTDCE